MIMLICDSNIKLRVAAVRKLGVGEEVVAGAAVDIPPTHATNAAVERGPDSPKKEKSVFRESAASVVPDVGADN